METKDGKRNYSHPFPIPAIWTIFTHLTQNRKHGLQIQHTHGRFFALTTRLHEDRALQGGKGFYKFIWVRDGKLDIEVDHVVMHLRKGELVTLSPLHHVDMLRAEGHYLSVLFNSNFYCIYGHGGESSRHGFLFHGSSNILHLSLDATETERPVPYHRHVGRRMRRGRQPARGNAPPAAQTLIIVCTRMARLRLETGKGRENGFDIIRQFYVLVDNHFKEKKQVQDYAEMLYRSPKTLSNLFSLYGLDSPLHIIHERIDAEARRCCSIPRRAPRKSVRYLDLKIWPRSAVFFKKMNRKSISDFRREEKKEDDRPTGLA